MNGVQLKTFLFSTTQQSLILLCFLTSSRENFLAYGTFLGFAAASFSLCCFCFSHFYAILAAAFAM
jgi:hypothetical protein